ncbi:MAG: chromosomal replication initiation protein DnaA [Omnitrophica WOR_2 bacterium GWA2_47_8]|nr:MAG: chromosomal replication initiation protein DnaA [Omnitrophica WOR_2 bacterium GWA2_47_8]
MSLLATWQKAQDILKEKIGATSYETWFSCIEVKEKSPNTLIIETPDEFFKNWIVEHYLNTIQENLNIFEDSPVALEFSVNAGLLEKGTQGKIMQLEKSFHDPEKNLSNLNPRFTFENFVVGPSNRFAHAACLAVADSPAKAYNPLFIYGHVGLGKTHLMQAIANRIRQNDQNKSIKYLYISSERFTNELIDGIRNRATSQFRQKYRSIDVLLIDDIQFIAGKESTQEEFFHTFNTLHDARKQIIISSDRPPKDIPNLEERLRSRFAWGLITDVQLPDFETRVAILRKKIEREPVVVSDEIVFFIAEQIKTNIRELEGALIRVIAYSLLEEKPITLEMAKSVLSDMVKETSKIISIDMIQKSVTEFYRISLSDLRAKRRHKNLVLPRQIAMYLTRKLTNLSLPEIGYAFGGKDHTTVLHSCRKIDEKILTSKELKNTIDKLTIALKQ